MKIKEEHFNVLNGAIEAQKDRFYGAALAYKSANLPEKRYLWDVLRASGIFPGQSHNGSKWPVYDYANDCHIETAIKKALRINGIVY